MKRLLRNIPLKRFCRDLNLKFMGFEWKSFWVWERFDWGKGRELKSVLKNYHISPIKLKIHIFCSLHTREITCKKHIWSTKFFMVYLNYRSEHIWPPTRKWLQMLEAFHLASLQIITFDHFWTIHHFWDQCLKFLIFQYWE